MAKRTALTSYQQEDTQHRSGYKTYDHERQQDQTAACRLRRCVEQHELITIHSCSSRAVIVCSALKN